MIVTESDIKKMVKESVKRILNEFYGTFDDTSDAPWNKPDDSKTSKETTVWDEFYCNLTDIINQYPQYTEMLQPLQETPGDWTSCNVGKVTLSYDMIESGFEQDEDGYVFANNSEINPDSLEIKLSQDNQYRSIFPPELIKLLENAVQTEFSENRDWFISFLNNY